MLARLVLGTASFREGARAACATTERSAPATAASLGQLGATGRCAAAAAVSRRRQGLEIATRKGDPKHASIGAVATDHLGRPETRRGMVAMECELAKGTRILIVDDEAPVRQVLASMLERTCVICTTAANVSEARQRLAESGFELVISDLSMPGESATAFIESLAHGPEDIATLVISGLGDRRLAQTVIDLGAYGYISKPFTLDELVIAVHGALRRRELEIERRRLRELKEKALQEETIHRLAAAAELRDEETGQHVVRMAEYTAIVAREFGLPEERLELIRLASPLHDIGKIGIPDAILRKPGKLTLEERRVMETHAQIGHEVLAGSEAELLRLAALLALTHHERYDGGGYPRGLRGEEIPLEGRIIAVADFFDALTSDRVYRAALPIGEAVAMMEAERGRHFDPGVLDAFLRSLEAIKLVHEQLRDSVDLAA
jgi:putative two-component system response regulator